jgi:Tfp pilus assembly protein PilF
MYFNIPAWKIFISVALLIIFTIFVCRYFKKHPYLPVGWFWYLGTFVPVIGIIQIADHTMADRYAYVPFIGIFIIIAWGAEEVLSKTFFLKKILIFILVLIIMFFTVASRNQVNLWVDTVTLFENALEKDPNNHMAYQIIGQEMAKRGEYEKALKYFDMTLKIRPQFYPAYNNKAVVFQKIGKRHEALQNFEMSARIYKFSAETYFSIGFIYLEDGKFNQSIEYALKAIKIKPDYQAAYDMAGIAFVEKGKIQEGIKYFEKSLRINPLNKNTQNNLRMALEKSKKID